MEFDGVDGLTVSGNTVPLTSGTMATSRRLVQRQRVRQLLSRRLQEASITNPAC